MSTKKKLLQAAAGSAGGAGLDVDEVFSTYLYTGTGSSQTITNDIDLSGEGGLVWIKSRSFSYPHNLYDTERGATKRLKSSSTSAESTLSTGLTAFSSTGFTLGGDNDTNGTFSDAKYASWTFRKAPKFFDVVTWTSTGSPMTIAHDLGLVPGMIIVKSTNRSTNWAVYHRGANASPETVGLFLNLDFATDDSTGYWNDTAPTSTHFTVGDGGEVGGNTGDSMVAYLFAHNNSDGEFGPDGDQDIIKCGSYAGNGSTDGPEVDLGFEPQWLMFKRSDSTSSWFMYDVMRGIVTSGNDAYLLANGSGAENTGANFVDVTPTGFKITSSNSNINNSSGTYIYMAIRRGPLAEPESATDVFKAVTRNSSTGGVNYYTGFPVDMSIYNARTSPGNYVHARLTASNRLQTSNTNAEISGDAVDFQTNVGYQPGSSSTNTNALTWNWKRAPSYFDVVAYTGNGTAGHTVSHNLGVAPEMMWVKRRNATDIWVVYNETVGNTGFLRLNDTNAVTTSTVAWNDTSPTATDFTLGTYAAVNTSGSTYIAYLFASLAGISKVGSYTGNGSTQTIDCGFSSGARFVLIKRTDTANSWFVFDSERGIVAGNDPYLQLNATSAEDELGGLDAIDPHSSGFIVNSNLSGINNNNGTFIFYAIA